MKILYIVSTLKRSGPTNQLYNLISNLNRENFKPIILTLSPESRDSRWQDYASLDIEMHSLNLSRISGLVYSKSRLKSLINQLKPDLIHTQGIRADSLLASLKTVTPWALTAHNFVFDDYLMKFGKLRGFLLALKHISSQKKCENVVACSKSIQKQLLSKGIKSHAIQNGVSFQSLVLNKFDFRDLEPPIFITVNNLVRRKNTKLLIEAFCLWKSQSNANGSLVILGDGEERPYLEKISCGAIHFMGNVPNVVDYLASADYFMSASLAEGLPYTVLEALASGLPVILSDIPPHMEIHDESRGGARIFKLTDGVAGLIRELNQVSVNFEADANEDVQRVATEVFSAELMATRYQEYYSRLLKATEFG